MKTSMESTTAGRSQLGRWVTKQKPFSAGWKLSGETPSGCSE
jgi:hypothetical protein